MTTGTITAIETEYGGCRFRSRLEARVAVALDANGYPWAFEPEGFETPAGRYLPDFLVLLGAGVPQSDFSYWLEVKPDNYPLPTDARDLARLRHVAVGTHRVLYLIRGLEGCLTAFMPNGSVLERGSTVAVLGGRGLAAAKAARFEFGEAGS